MPEFSESPPARVVPHQIGPSGRLRAVERFIR